MPDFRKARWSNALRGCSRVPRSAAMPKAATRPPARSRPRWREHVNQALAVLHTLREPDEAMAAVQAMPTCGVRWSKPRSRERVD